MKAELVAGKSEAAGLARSTIRRFALEGVSLLTLAASMAMTASVQAQAVWTGAVSEDWFQNGNWDGGQQPGAADDVHIYGAIRQPLIGTNAPATAGTVNVGWLEPGALSVENGVLEVSNLLIGIDDGDGNVLVAGENAVLISDGTISLGHAATGTLAIRDGALVVSQNGVVGAELDSLGIVTLDNAAWTTTGGGMTIGNYGEGRFTVSGGGVVNNDAAYIGFHAGSQGTLTVTGPGSAWLDGGDMYVGAHLGGSGHLDVSDGGLVRVSNSLYVGFGGEGTALVSGEGTQVEVWGGLSVGGAAGGALTISDGATVESQSGMIEAAAGSQGIMTVTGTGSAWTMSEFGGGLTIGLDGSGALTVTDGARVETNDIFIAVRGDADGALVISDGGQVKATNVMMSGDADTTGAIRLESGGVLEAEQVQRYDGAGTITFDGGTLRLTANQGFLFDGFQVGDLILDAGGGTIDTQGYNIQTDLGFVGSGGLTKTGTGTLQFWNAGNSYSGDTVVSAGTVRARGVDVLSAASTHEISTGATLRLDNNRNQTIGGLAGSGSVVLGNSTLTTGANNASTRFGGVVSGSGALVKVGTGALILSGANTYTGGTTINAGTLQLGTNTDTGAILGAVTIGAGATFYVDNGDTSGITTIANDGLLYFNRANTAGSAEIISNGGLYFFDTSTAGSAEITNNSLLEFYNDSTASEADIANNHTVNFYNASTAGEADILNRYRVNFYGTSTAGEADILNNFVVSFNNTSTAGDAKITNNLTLFFNDTSTAGGATITNAIDGSLYFADTSTAGNATITNNGSLYSSDASTAGNATIINDRFWYLNDTSTAGSATITNDGSLNFYNTSTAGSADIINDANAGVAFFDTSTAGGAAITNDGSLSFYNTSTADTAKITNDGNLIFRDTSTAGSATIINEAGGRTDFSESASGGDARLIANGGAFDFSNLASSGTTAGSIEGAGDFRLGSKTLTVGSNNRSTTVTGTIADGGANGSVGALLVKVGTGTLTLAGTNTYTGTTKVLGGLLNVTGRLASALEVSSGGRVGGTGTLATVTVGNGGILAPGNSIGAITVGTLTLGSGSIYEVELIAGGHTPGVHNDLTTVTGIATIDAGTSIRVLAENGTDNGRTYLPGVYTIITTGAPGALTVNAAPIVTDDFAFLNVTGSHDGQNFYLTSSLVATTFCLPGASANQCGVGDAAFALAPGNPVFDAVVGLGENEVDDALDSLSGEAHASVQTVIESTFAQLGQTLTRRGSDGLAAPKAAMEPLNYAAGVQGPGLAAIGSAMFSPVAASAWLTPLGGGGHVAADANAAALDWQHGGLVGGYEAASNTALGGLAFGYQRGSASIAARRSQSTLDSFILGTYAALRDGPNAISGALTLGASHISTSRTVNVGGTTSQANADYWTQSIGLSLEAAHDIELGNGMTISPLATLGLGWSRHGGFVETGAGAFNLTAAPMAAIALDAGLGLNVSQVVETEVGTLTLSGRALWEHNFTGVNTQSMTFAGGATPFTVNGPAAGADRLRIGAGLAFETGDSLTMGLVYDATFSAAQQVHKASASFNLKF